jgi:hypothetical protein
MCFSASLAVFGFSASVASAASTSFSASDLLNAGFSPSDLLNGSFSDLGLPNAVPFHACRGS